MRSAVLTAALLTIASGPASAVTIVNGVTLITQADAFAGGVTPNDTAGYPITISVSGTYRLSGNLAPTSGQSGFAVTAPEVTLDFAGFTMAGGGMASNGVVGINRALTVMNGTIRGFLYDGIYVQAPMLMVDKMRIAENKRFGINAAHLASNEIYRGNVDGNAMVRNSVLFHNQKGIVCQAACLVDGNIISYSETAGVTIEYEFGSTVSNNTIIRNNVGVVGNRFAVVGNTIVDNYGGNIQGTPYLRNNICSDSAC